MGMQLKTRNGPHLESSLLRCRSKKRTCVAGEADGMTGWQDLITHRQTHAYVEGDGGVESPGVLFQI